MHEMKDGVSKYQFRICENHFGASVEFVPQFLCEDSLIQYWQNIEDVSADTIGLIYAHPTLADADKVIERFKASVLVNQIIHPR